MRTRLCSWAAILALAVLQQALALGHGLSARLQVLGLFARRVAALTDVAQLFVVGLDPGLEEQLERGQPSTVVPSRTYAGTACVVSSATSVIKRAHSFISRWSERRRDHQREFVRDRVVVHERHRELAAVFQAVESRRGCAA